MSLKNHPLLQQISVLETLPRLTLNFLINSLMPLTCIFCQQLTTHPQPLCASCRQLILRFSTSPSCSAFSSLASTLNSSNSTNLTSINYKHSDEQQPPWQTLRYLSAYQSPVKELLQKAKFSHQLAVFKVLAELFAQRLSKQTIDPELVLIPVPLHQSRLLERGYNQALEIAYPLSRLLKLPINRHCVTRIAQAKTQHFLTVDQRLSNAQNLFESRASVPKKVAIIDDIFTTGATMRSMCDTLNQAGAIHIEVWILARTPKLSSGILSP